MKKITKKSRQEYLKKMLRTNRTWAIKALLTIYEYQTAEEQNIGHTVEHNGVGFTGFDAEILTSFSEQYLQRRRLSLKQWELLHKKMPKYWRQILNIADQAKLDTLVAQEL